MLEKIFENNDFIVWKDNKGYDFAYDIENKTDNKLTISYGDNDGDILKIDKWVGLFSNQEHIIENIICGNYEIKNEEVMNNE